MRDIGDAFSEHKQHRKDVESAQHMNLTLPEFYRWQSRIHKEKGINRSEVINTMKAAIAKARGQE